MPRFRAAYPPEFRRQMVELVRSVRTPDELSREFEPTAQSIANWVRQAEVDAGTREGVTSDDKARIAALERENRELRRANTILRQASAYFAQAELDRPQR